MLWLLSCIVSIDHSMYNYVWKLYGFSLVGLESGLLHEKKALMFRSFHLFSRFLFLSDVLDRLQKLRLYDPLLFSSHPFRQSKFHSFNEKHSSIMGKFSNKVSELSEISLLFSTPLLYFTIMTEVYQF